MTDESDTEMGKKFQAPDRLGEAVTVRCFSHLLLAYKIFKSWKIAQGAKSSSAKVPCCPSVTGELRQTAPC